MHIRNDLWQFLILIIDSDVHGSFMLMSYTIEVMAVLLQSYRSIGDSYRGITVVVCAYSQEYHVNRNFRCSTVDGYERVK